MTNAILAAIVKIPDKLSGDHCIALAIITMGGLYAITNNAMIKGYGFEICGLKLIR